MNIEAFLQTCPQRREIRQQTEDSIRESDIGEKLRVLEHPPQQSMYDFFASVLEQMAGSAAEYVLRFEDDVLVNRHILHNVLTWPALSDPLFGAGWLFVPEAALGDRSKVGRSSGIAYRNAYQMWASLAVVLPTRLVPLCRDQLMRRGKADQDLVLSEAVWRAGKRCFFHEPSLVENRDPPSAFGTTYPKGTTPRHLFAGKTFAPDWKR